MLEKGYRTCCEFPSVLVSALHEVSVTLECRVDILKVTRCSDLGSKIAHPPSKVEYVKFLDLTNGLRQRMMESKVVLPPTLLSWVSQPHEDWNLAKKNLTEMCGYSRVLGYRY